MRIFYGKNGGRRINRTYTKTSCAVITHQMSGSQRISPHVPMRGMIISVKSTLPKSSMTLEISGNTFFCIPCSEFRITMSAPSTRKNGTANVMYTEP